MSRVKDTPPDTSTQETSGTRSTTGIPGAAADSNPADQPSFIAGAAAKSDDRLRDADKIIKRNSKWAGGLGLIPVPVVDIVAVTAFQVKMVRELCEFYGQPYSEERAKTWVAALIGGFAPSTIGLSAASLVKGIPLVGAVASLAAMPVFSYASTFAVGRVFVRHFEEGGTLLTLDPQKVKDYYSEMYRLGVRQRRA